MLKATGYVKRFDTLGRLQIPIELRKKIGIYYHQEIEIYQENQYIHIRKYKNSCKFCGSKNIKEIFKKVYICKKCSSDLRRSDNYEILKNGYNLKIIK